MLLIANLIVIGIFAILDIIRESLIIIFVIAIHVIISYVIFGLLSNRVFSTAKRLENGVYKSGSRLIGWFGILLMLVYAFIILDRVYNIALNVDQHNIFGSLAWIAGMLAGYVAYVGFCLPE